METSTISAASKSTSEGSFFTDQQIRHVAESGPHRIAEWTSHVANDRGVRVRVRPNESFIKAVSRLSDGVVDLDHVEELLVALVRAGVINAFQSGLLQIRYLR